MAWPGETTPGPLIMVVAFVGFVGGYVHPMFGADHPFLAGAVAASLVTWFTFLPSFLFILAGPLVESTHNEMKFTAPLTASPRPWWGDPEPGAVLRLPRAVAQRLRRGFDWPSALIAAGAALALFRWRRGVIRCCSPVPWRVWRYTCCGGDAQAGRQCRPAPARRGQRPACAACWSAW
jgi:chromate transporter